MTLCTHARTRPLPSARPRGKRLSLRSRNRTCKALRHRTGEPRMLRTTVWETSEAPKNDPDAKTRVGDAADDFG